MLRVGLTGGIGAGKSTVAAGLAARGAALIDADRVAREVVEPGTPGLDALVERFGLGILAPDGRLDRGALASVVFADRKALADLNAITHPLIEAVIAERLASLEGTDRIVVVDVPLLDAAGVERYRFDVVIVVDVPESLAFSRLTGARGMSEADARARIDAQVGRQQRLALATLVVDNSGSREKLEEQMDRIWGGLVARAR
ncbi:MAG TPA: dephospho-CoA kinase [Acidimicrobiales bacterium]|nr:dephospho-CoA kinase [Acidimicrobiales bacterium]